MANTRFHHGIAYRLVLALMGISACDAGEEAEDVEFADDDLEERNWGCAYYASSPPAVDAKKYFSNGGKSEGGCDLFVIKRTTPELTDYVTFTGIAYSTRPIVTTEARLWARNCAGQYCSTWTMFDDQPYGWSTTTGLGPECEPDEPCLWRARVIVHSDPYEDYNDFRFGVTVLDDEGEPVYVAIEDRL